MPHLPAITSSTDPETAALIEQITTERSGKLLLLYKTLLNSPPVARGWLSLMTAIRQKTTISGALREMVILRIAFLNGAPYEYENHVPFALREGVSQQWIEAIGAGDIPAGFSELESDVIRYTDEMTRDVKVTPETYQAMARHFDAQQILELTATIASYNMVSRVLVALDIDTEHH